MVTPVLVDVSRGGQLESCHRGALVVVDRTGAVVLALGDVSRAVLPRSAIKAMQCIPLITSGAADRFGFGAAQIALCAGSHGGGVRHVLVAREMLAAAGLEQSALVCGAHPPLDQAAAQALLRQGESATGLHNNCSGKHAGMLATAVHLGESTADYGAPDHPVQQRIRAVLEAFAGAELGKDVCFVDGCSAPNWVLPLDALARAFAGLMGGDGCPSDYRVAAERVIQACWAEPELVAGPGRPDTRWLQRFGGEVFVKSGAEGVYCGGVRGRGLGFALKIDDGAARASEAVIGALIARLVDGAEGLAGPALLRNWDGLEVGRIAVSRELVAALAAL